MKYLNLINGNNESDMLRSLSRPANDFKYETIYLGRYQNRKSRITDRINKNFSAMKKFKFCYKSRHPKIYDFVNNLYEPFIGSTPSETLNKFGTARTIGYPDNLVKASIDMREIYGLKLINLAYDYTEHSAGNIHVTYDVNREQICRFSADTLDPLAFRVNEFGLPEFTNDDKVVMSVFVPVSYMRDLFVYANEYLIEKLRSSGNNRIIEPNVNDVLRLVAKVINIEIKNGIIIALYKDRFRELILSQLMCIYNIIGDEIKDGGRSLLSANLLADKIKLKYESLMKKFHMSTSNASKTEFNTYNDSLVSITSDILCNYGKSSIDVWTFYYSLIDLGQYEIDRIVERLELWKLFPPTNYHADPEYLNMSKGNEFADVLRSTLLLNRIVPFVYYVENIVGTGIKFVDLNKFNIKLGNYINNDIIPCAARYHRLHRNSMAYLIDKLRDIYNFYNESGFRSINSKVAECLVGKGNTFEINDNLPSIVSSTESWEMKPGTLIGLKPNDYIVELQSHKIKERAKMIVNSESIEITKADVEKYYNINDKQKHKAPKNIEKMFDMVKAGYFVYVGYDPCKNIDLTNESESDMETVLEEGQNDLSNTDAIEKRKAAVKFLYDITKDDLVNDNMKSNPYAVLGNVSFMGKIGTPFEKCQFVYNRKTGNLVLDSVNRGIYHDMNDDSYRSVLDFYTNPDENYIPHALYCMLKMWELFGSGNRYESPEDYYMDDEEFKKYVD